MKKSRFGKGKHKKFQDDWEKAKEPVLEGVTFYVKYLGMVLMDKSNDEMHTAEGVRKILHNAKYSNKIQKVSLQVTPQFIKQMDLDTQEDLQEISIHRISYCTADKNNDKIFGYIARNPANESLELHCYLCAKRKIAEALALTVAQAFNIAFEYWEDSKDIIDSAGTSPFASSSFGTSPLGAESSKPNGIVINRTPLEDLPECTSPHQKSAPQAIPGSHHHTVDSSPEENGSLTQPKCWSSGASPISPPTLLHPPPPGKHGKGKRGSASGMSGERVVLTVTAQGFPKMSTSAPPSVPAIPPSHRPRKSLPEAVPVNGHNGHGHLTNGNKDHETAELLKNWHITDDTDLDDCFSVLAQSRSNPQLLDMNVKRGPFDADVIVHFSAENNENDSLLSDKLEDEEPNGNDTHEGLLLSL